MLLEGYWQIGKTPVREEQSIVVHLKVAPAMLLTVICEQAWFEYGSLKEENKIGIADLASANKLSLLDVGISRKS